MPKILNVNIIVPDDCDKERIRAIVLSLVNQGYFVPNATLQTNELRFINGEGFIKLK